MYLYNLHAAGIMKFGPGMIPTIPAEVACNLCDAKIKVGTYRKFVYCPFCGNKQNFPGFRYQEIDPASSKYSSVKYWMDCPACRSTNMYLGASGLRWRCPDCGYTITKLQKMTSVFWFCDNCDTFLNVQPGFDTKKRHWKCSECGFDNDVSVGNID